MEILILSITMDLQSQERLGRLIDSLYKKKLKHSFETRQLRQLASRKKKVHVCQAKRWMHNHVKMARKQ